MRKRMIFSTTLLTLITACSDMDTKQNQVNESSMAEKNAPLTMNSAAAIQANPFFTQSSLYLQIPPFDKITNAHFAPAFEKGMLEHKLEIEKIASNPLPATFDNTLIAMEKSGQLLSRVASVFFALSSANTNEEIEKLEAELSPKLSAHQDEIQLNHALFKRVEFLYERKNDLNLDKESVRLIEETYKDFISAGAQLSDAQKKQLKKINADIATLQTQFSQNVKKEVNKNAIIVDSKEELNGLTNAQIAAAKLAAQARDLPNKYVLPLLNTSTQPSLSSLENRALRQRILQTSLGRGSSGGEFDNTKALTQVALLRAKRAQLMGFENHAAYQLTNQTAKTTQAVNQRLSSLAPRAVANAKKEAAALQEMINSQGENFELQAWDWAYYSEKVRAKQFNFDESQLKPYLEMNNVLVNGVFFAAEKVFGLTFKERKDLPTYHPDVKVWEVFDADGSTLALFIQDFYARESKRGGAWMNAYVSQSHLMGTKPVVANHLNVPKPPEGQETLLTWDEVNTMFHEFGHALHGMFSDVTYPSFSGTSVPRDFVEYPSQVNEMWADWPEVLENYAVHYQTGQAIPKDLLDKVIAASKFNQGYATTEYLAASLLDQSWHQLTPEQVPSAQNLLAFEDKALSQAGVKLSIIPPRYRSTYFSHIIGGYSAGYYSYIWSEVLDADSVEWFIENGGMTRKNGDHFRKTLLSRGGSEDAMQIFKNFRGAEPKIEPLLKRRGLTP